MRAIFLLFNQDNIISKKLIFSEPAAFNSRLQTSLFRKKKENKIP